MILLLMFEILFYVGTSLFLPFFYAYYLKDPIWFPIGICIILTMGFGFPIYIKNLYIGFKKAILEAINKDKKTTHINMAKRILTSDFLTLKLRDSKPKTSEIILASALTYFLIPLITIIPYLYSGISLEDAVFESFSGWTSTGLTVLKIDDYSDAFKFFRTMTQWVGGMGIVLFALLVIKGPATGKMYMLEGKKDVGESIPSMARKIWIIYTIITIVGTLALNIAGLDIFSSLNYSMTSVATGGFAVHNDTSFMTDAQKLIIAGIMFAGAISFAVYIDLIKIKWKSLFNSETLFLALMAITGGLAMYYTSTMTPVESITIAISSFSTCGYQPVDLSKVSYFTKFTSTILMIIGGSFGSTAGGLKVWRVFAVIKHVLNRVKKTFSNQKIVRVVKMGRHIVDESTLLEFSTYFFMYFTLVALCSALFILSGHYIHNQEDYSVANSMLISASILGNVGLSPIDMSLIPVFTKYAASFFMYAGRIEIFPLLVLIRFVKNKITR